MIQITNKSACTGCGACRDSCPTGAISMIADEEGFLYPSVEADKCIHCGKCDKRCPVVNGVLKKSDSDFEILAYAAQSKNEEIRQKSSSGGIFTEIAAHILAQNGVIFGAAFDNEFQLVHTEIEKLEDLEVLRGSKYVQSEIGNAYMKAKEYLDVGRKVLFTGTPCQIAGLYAFLNRDYDGLYTQDIICHGVPSPLVWRKYVKHREDKASSQLEQMSFRYKKHGWRMYSVRFKFSNNSEYEKVLSDDPYMRGFLSNLTLRPSCYSCAFKTKSRVSDFTLADFWGVDKVLPTIDDDKGTSLVLLHSEKAQRLFEEIGEGISRWEASIDEAIRYNSAMVKSVAPHAGRERFFNQIRDREFGCIKPYIKIPLMQRIKRTIRRLQRAVKKA